MPILPDDHLFLDFSVSTFSGIAIMLLSSNLINSFFFFTPDRFLAGNTEQVEFEFFQLLLV